VYLILGTYYSITRPLTDAAITRVMVSMNRASAILAVIGYVFICTFAYKRYQLTMVNSEPGDENSVERDAYKYIVHQVAVLQPSFWIQLAGVAMAKYFFTTLAGVDWMMVEIGKQRHYEILMEISQKIRDLEEGGSSVRYPKGLRKAAEREENLKAAEERGLRLDCVFYILYDEVPMHVAEVKSSTGSGGAHRRRTVLQPAVSGMLELAEMKDAAEASNEPKASSPSSPRREATAPGVPPAPPESPSETNLDSTWNFFFGLRTPPTSNRTPASFSAPRPNPGWPARPPGVTYSSRAPLATPLAGPLSEPQRLLPPHWQGSLGSPSTQHLFSSPAAPGTPQMRPHF
ncbi:ABC transporter F family member 2, partial [Durusdinium trenchii]